MSDTAVLSHALESIQKHVTKIPEITREDRLVLYANLLMEEVKAEILNFEAMARNLSLSPGVLDDYQQLLYAANVTPCISYSIAEMAHKLIYFKSQLSSLKRDFYA